MRTWLIVIETHKIRTGPVPCGRARNGARLRGNAESSSKNAMNPRGTTWFNAIAVPCTRLVLLGTAFRRYIRGGLHSTAAIILCLSASLACRTALADEALPRSVLVIDQFEPASAGSAALLSGLRSTLKSNSTSPISIYVENLDLGRFGGLRFQACRTRIFPREVSGQPRSPSSRPSARGHLNWYCACGRSCGPRHRSSFRRSTGRAPTD